MYKGVASVDGYPKKVYLGNVEDDLKHGFYNHRISFNNEGRSTDTTLSKYVWKVKKKINIMPSMYQPIQIFPRNASCVCKKNLKFLITSIQINCLIKSQSLFQSTTTLTSFYCLVIHLTIRLSDVPSEIYNDISTVK